MGHHIGHGLMAAAMVHCVLSINICFVHDLYGRILPRGTSTWQNLQNSY